MSFCASKRGVMVRPPPLSMFWRISQHSEVTFRKTVAGGRSVLDQNYPVASVSTFHSTKRVLGCLPVFTNKVSAEAGSPAAETSGQKKEISITASIFQIKGPSLLRIALPEKERHLQVLECKLPLGARACWGTG